MRNVWKWLGLAGIAGVAAGGVLVARDQRRRNSYTPDQVRARLRQRLAESGRLDELADKALSAMRKQFGEHDEKPGE